MRYLILLFAILSSIPIAYAQDPAPKLNLKQLQGNISVVEGGLGNMTMVIADSELLVVDTKSKEAGVALEELITTQLKGKKIKYIINTHMHFDHTGNNTRLGKGVTIIAQQNSRNTSKADSQAVSRGWPNLTFDHEMNLYFGGEEIKLIHYPSSHTDHDLVVYFAKSKIISMGDMYFSGMYPFIATGGDLNGLIANLDTVINMLPPDVKIVPGHGPISSLSDLKATHKMLIETSLYIKKQIDSGKNLEAIKKDGLPGWTPIWGNGFCKEDCWIETLYDFLKK